MRSLHLAPDGVYMTAQSPGRRCALTAPFHPYRGFPRRYLSVALALESPPPAVSRHPCPAVPGLSSRPCGPAAIQPPLSRDDYTADQSGRQSKLLQPAADIRHPAGMKKTDGRPASIGVKLCDYKMISSRPQVSHSTNSPAFTLRETEDGTDILQPPHWSPYRAASGGTLCFLISR